ncbi:MAG: RNA pseudouridine synthase [Isosphaeraceae bacterium]
MMPNVLYEDNHCLALDKPAGLLTQGDITGEPTLVDEARAYLKTRYAKPGDVYIGLVHRIDRPTSGVVLLARTSKAAARLSLQFREGTVKKTYLAVVEGHCREEEGEWSHTLRKDERKNVVDVVAPGTPGGQTAILSFRVIRRRSDASLMQIRPRTGRSHQIRVQLAAQGIPIVGDRKYGASRRIVALDGKPRVALHALQLIFRHPTRGEEISVRALVPADWPWPEREDSWGSWTD